jgi:putative restriction endonuclease
MARLPKDAMLSRVIRAAQRSGWSVNYALVPPEHPYRIHFLKGEQGIDVILYIWNITHGGGRERAADEYRIQVTGVSSIDRIAGFKTLILGYWEENDVFAGWDAAFHAGPVRRSPSFQIRQESLLAAHQFSFAVCPKGQGELAIAFEPDYFMNYVRNLEGLHTAGNQAVEIALLDRIADTDGEIEDDEWEMLPQDRQRVVQEIAKLQRDSSFRKRVLSAYGEACAFCGMQLELVDAAHIVPVSHAASTDLTNNGLCLCALHHRAFDAGLLAVLPDYQIVVNQERLHYLRSVNRARGEDHCLGSVLAQIRLPPERSQRPDASMIDLALQIRALPRHSLRPTVGLVQNEQP